MSDSSFKNFKILSDQSKSNPTSERKKFSDSNTSKILSYSQSKSHLTFGGQNENRPSENRPSEQQKPVRNFVPLRDFSKKISTTRDENIEITENPFIEFKQVDSGTSSYAAIVTSTQKTPVARDSNDGKDDLQNIVV